MNNGTIFDNAKNFINESGGFIEYIISKIGVLFNLLIGTLAFILNIIVYISAIVINIPYWIILILINLPLIIIWSEAVICIFAFLSSGFLEGVKISSGGAIIQRKTSYMKRDYANMFKLWILYNQLYFEKLIRILVGFYKFSIRFITRIIRLLIDLLSMISQYIPLPFFG